MSLEILPEELLFEIANYVGTNIHYVSRRMATFSAPKAREAGREPNIIGSYDFIYHVA
jgi:hypothetical protein